MMRQRLPNRRASEVLQFQHDNVKYIGALSWFPNGRVAELFLNTHRANSTAGVLASDAAICASLALQHGVKLADLRPALGDSPLARLIDIVSGRVP
jgi:hypothetical protein